MKDETPNKQELFDKWWGVSAPIEARAHRTDKLDAQRAFFAGLDTPYDRWNAGRAHAHSEIRKELMRRAGIAYCAGDDEQAAWLRRLANITFPEK